MGLGGGWTEWDEYEWVRLPDLPEPTASAAPGDALAEALIAWFVRHPVWADDGATRILLADLDNLRADPVRWRARMAVIVMLARQADHVVIAGQYGAVARARPHLAEFSDTAQGVPDGSDVADHALLDGAAAVLAGDQAVPVHGADVLVISNDGIFAALAATGRLTVLSPGGDALSDRLRDAAANVVDLAALEEHASSPARTARR